MEIEHNDAQMRLQSLCRRHICGLDAKSFTEEQLEYAQDTFDIIRLWAVRLTNLPIDDGQNSNQPGKDLYTF